MAYAGIDSTIQIWKTLSNLYSSKTTSKLMYYRQAFQSQKKGYYGAWSYPQYWSNPFMVHSPLWSSPPVPSPMTSSSSPIDNDAQALVATPNVVDDNAWYPGSEATHHLTNNVTSLTKNLLSVSKFTKDNQAIDACHL
ncbi:hypothetical protein J1N35_010706 [Gossypium stocksii]|uniref:Uncharacterized protein n=1 Tax=Gossypium stocksii TaxID=47602 RepID=A0A9D3W2U9_9ROSI|nr:hypothetical protein J1N35_010706 [Gossypium stocksii]